MKIHRRPKFRIDPQGRETFAGMTVMASAALVNKGQVRTVIGQKSDWQKDGWLLYDSVTEFRYGVGWVANACSRARLYVGRIDPDGSSRPTPVNANPEPGAEDPEAMRLIGPLLELFGGQTGQSEMLRRLAIHLNVPGESFLVGFDDAATGARRWLVCSGDEIQDTPNGYRLHSPEEPNSFIDLDPSQSVILRVWRPHARYAQKSDSPLVALRQPLRELENLSAHITATAESRLAGAGILFVPDELTIPSGKQGEGVNPVHPDPFTSGLIEAMAAPLKNRDSASAIVPLVVRGPAAAGGALKHLSFATNLDANVQALRESAIRRVATGMDMPPEILTGTGQVNHWGQWQIEESAIKLHIEPMLGLICDSLTSHYLQPALKAQGQEDWSKYAVWYDISELALRPDRTEEAERAYGLGLISEIAYRRELGFSDEDAPEEDETVLRLMRQAATQNPYLAPYLLPRLGVAVPEGARRAAEARGVTGTRSSSPTNAQPASQPTGQPPAQPARRLGNKSAPDRGDLVKAMARPPVTASAGPSPWMIRLLDMAVRRALARAGQVLIRSTPRSERTRLQQMDREAIHLTIHAEPGNLDHLLHGAYAEFHASTPGEACLHEAVDDYVRALLLAREEHRPQYLATAIRQFGCDEAVADAA